MGTWKWRTGIVAVATSVALAGCGSGGTKPAAVASLAGAKGPGASTTSTLPTGNPTQLVDEWTTCMRGHGDPGQPDPTIDTNGVIHIELPTPGTPALQSAQDVCQAYLSAASTALGGPQSPPDPAKLLKFSQCMQKNGIPDFPDPSGGGLSIHISPGSDINPANPTFAAASKLCSAKAGVPGFAGKPQRGAIQETGPGPGPAGGPTAGASSSPSGSAGS